MVVSETGEVGFGGVEAEGGKEGGDDTKVGGVGLKEEAVKDEEGELVWCGRRSSLGGEIGSA
jgi:hypothetical protein